MGRFWESSRNIGKNLGVVRLGKGTGESRVWLGGSSISSINVHWRTSTLYARCLYPEHPKSGSPSICARCFAMCYRRGIEITFSSVQSLSHVRLFAIPWIAARQASLSITNIRGIEIILVIVIPPLSRQSRARHVAKWVTSSPLNPPNSDRRSCKRGKGGLEQALAQGRAVSKKQLRFEVKSDVKSHLLNLSFLKADLGTGASLWEGFHRSKI